MKPTVDPREYHLNWNALKADWLLWVVMLAAVAAGAILYPRLPEQVPSHWNFQGQVDGYSSRAFGAFFFPLLTIGVYILLVVAPKIDPRQENYARFAGAYRLLRWGFVLLFTALWVVTILAALSYPVNVGLIVKAGVGLLLVVIGNVMGQMRHNYFVGIRTPWTLANEEVWRKTHRLGARMFVVCGLICLVLSPVTALWGAYFYFASIMCAAVVPIVFSYFAFHQT